MSDHFIVSDKICSKLTCVQALFDPLFMFCVHTYATGSAKTLHVCMQILALSWCCTHQLLNTLFEIYLV